MKWVMVFGAAATVSLGSGVWLGHELSAQQVRHVSTDQLPPPLDETATIDAGILVLPMAIIHGSPKRFTPIGIKILAEGRFFDFKHAVCDEAESVHGRVVRCQKPEVRR